MNNQRVEEAGGTARDSGDGMSEWGGDSRARDRLKELWQPGDLFHVFSRYPGRDDLPKVDRLAGILKKGLLAPASCDDGTVFSDLRLTVKGSPVPYDSLVFVHRFGPRSGIYTMSRPGLMTLFINPELPVLTYQEMGPHWVLLCMDEVYVPDRIGIENLIGLAVHPADVEQVMEQFLPDLKRLGIPLYLYDGTVLWPR